MYLSLSLQTPYPFPWKGKNKTKQNLSSAEPLPLCEYLCCLVGECGQEGFPTRLRFNPLSPALSSGKQMSGIGVET